MRAMGIEDVFASRRARILSVLAVAVTIAVLGVWAQTPALVGAGYDDGAYALLSRSLAHGDGYRITSVPGGVPGVKYPPLYPLSQVPFWWLADGQAGALHGIKLANGIYLGLAAGLFTLLLIETGLLSVAAAVLVALAGFAAGSMMLVTVYPISEPLFLVVTFLALWMADRTEPDAGPLRWLTVGTIAGLAFLTRTIGIAVVGAVLISAWRRGGGRRAGLIGTAALVVSLPWVAFVLLEAGRVPHLLAPQYGSYLALYLANVQGSVAAAFGIFTTNVGAILQTAGGRVLPQAGPLLGSAIGAAFLVLALLGSRRAFYRAPATAVFPWLYLIPVAFWSFPPFRFLFVLLPLLLALTVGAWAQLATRLAVRADRAWLRSTILAVGLAGLANLTFWGARSVARRVWEPAQASVTRTSEDVIDWVRAHTEPDAVVAYELDPLLALYTGRRAVPNSYSPVHPWYRAGPSDAAASARLLQEMGVDYVAVRRSVPAASEPIDRMVGSYPGVLHLVYVSPRGALIFRTDRAALDRALGLGKRGEGDPEGPSGPGVRGGERR